MVWFRVTQTGTRWNCDVWQNQHVPHGLLGLTLFGYARGELAGAEWQWLCFYTAPSQVAVCDNSMVYVIQGRVVTDENELLTCRFGGGLDEQELK